MKRSCGSKIFFSRLPRAALAAAVLGVLGPPALAGELVLAVENFGGGRHIDLGEVRSLGEDGVPTGDTVRKEVRVRVTNTGSRRYRVTQQFHGEPRNESGTSFEGRSLRMHARLREGSGTVRVPEPAPVRTGEQEVFLSDNGGEDAELVLTYDLTVAPLAQAGTYRSSITYRAQTL